MNRRRLLVACDLGRFILLGSIPLAFSLGWLSMAQLLLVVFAGGLLTVFFELADLAALPHVVQPHELARARSVSEGLEASAMVLGPSVGGLIVSLGRTTVSGATLAFLVDSLSYLGSAIALAGIRRPLQSAPAAERPHLSDAIRAGMRFLWQHPTLRPLMLLTTAVNFLQAPMSLLVVLVAQRRFDLDPAQIGMIFGLSGGAAVLGSLLAAWLYRPARLRLIVSGALLAWIVSALILAGATSIALLAAGLALTYLVWPIYAVALVSYRLTATPDMLQGRVISAFRTLSYGAEPLGMALGGLGASLLGTTPMFGLIGAGLLVSATVALRLRWETVKR